MERWASFDCYGTLVDWREGIRVELARLFGDERADELLSRYHAIEPAIQRDGALTYREVLTLTLARVADEASLTLPAGEEYALPQSLPSWPVFPEALEALLEAHDRSLRLAILSNTDRDLIEASMVAIGVPFELAVVGSEIGSYKPARRHWDVFAELTGATRDRHVHVAQSLFHDIATTSQLGVPSIWINRLGEQPRPMPTRELPDLTRLPDTLDELVSQ